VGVECLEVGEGDTGTEEAWVFVGCVLAVFCRCEDGDRLERIFFMSNDGGGCSGLSLCRSPDVLIDLFAGDSRAAFTGFEMHRDSGFGGVVAVAEGTFVVSLVRMYEEAMFFNGEERAELARTMIAFVIFRRSSRSILRCSVGDGHSPQKSTTIPARTTTSMREGITEVIL
jgi:hypothetical protein